MVVFCDKVACRWEREGYLCLCVLPTVFCADWFGSASDDCGDAVLYCVCIEHGSLCTSKDIGCSEGRLMFYVFYQIAL